MLEVHRAYEFHISRYLSEKYLIDGHEVLELVTTSTETEAPRRDVFRVHPGVQMIDLKAEFHDLQKRVVEEAYRERVPYLATETFPCGGGGSCTRQVNRTRMETRVRQVEKVVPVPEATCHEKRRLMATEGDAYVFQMEFVDEDLCRISCFVRASSSEERTSLEPCSDSLVVIDIFPESRAFNSGLVEGDLIVEYAGQPAGEIKNFTQRTRETFRKKSVELVVLRDGVKTALNVPGGDIQVRTLHQHSSK